MSKQRKKHEVPEGFVVSKRPEVAQQTGREKPLIVIVQRGEWLHAHMQQAMEELTAHLEQRGFRWHIERGYAPDAKRAMVRAFSRRNPWPDPDDKPFEHAPEMRRYHRILVVDSDMMRGPQPWSAVFDRLYERDLDIIAPLMYTRAQQYVHYFFHPEAPPGHHLYWPPVKVQEKPEGELPIICAAVGFGFTLIKHGVLEQVGAPWFLRVQPGVNPYRPKGEFGVDIGFCYNAWEAGIRVHVDPTVAVGHLKMVPLTPTPGTGSRQ